MRGWVIACWVGIAALAVGLAVGIAQQNPRAITYLALHLAAALGVFAVSKRRDALTFAFVFAMAFNAPGWGWRWLDVLWHYDDFAHALCTLAITPYAAVLLLRPLRKELLEHKFVLAIVIIALGISGNALWEIYEWICDHFVVPPGTMSITDTMSDLVSDCIGAVLAVPLGIYRLRRTPSET